MKQIQIKAITIKIATEKEEQYFMILMNIWTKDISRMMKMVFMQSSVLESKIIHEKIHHLFLQFNMQTES